jgi:hypothetical protein
MNRLATGQYELTVEGQTPQTGMLILSVAHRATSTVTAPDDNALTYQASASGSFLINSYDFPGLGFQDTKFAWAFISFDNPISPFFMAGDFNHDGAVNTADYDLWRTQFGQTGQSLAADGNGDGIVDSADFVIWRGSLAATSGPANSSALPEPASVCLAVIAVTPFFAGRFVAPWFGQPRQ